MWALIQFVREKGICIQVNIKEGKLPFALKSLKRHLDQEEECRLFMRMRGPNKLKPSFAFFESSLKEGFRGCRYYMFRIKSYGPCIGPSRRMVKIPVKYAVRLGLE